MKITRQRNLYLKRIFTQQPHKYSYDMSSGKYSLINKEGTEVQVNANGSLRQQFRPNFSGCIDHKIREQLSNRQPSVLHYVPDAKHDSKYHNMMPLKFSGYAQSPYKLKQSPDYLKAISLRVIDNQSKRKSSIKHRSMTQQTQQSMVQRIQILAQSFTKRQEPFFKKAYQSIATTNLSPNRKKKLCYNDKCRYLKQITLDSLLSYRERQSSIDRQTLGLSFHQKYLKQQLQETKRLVKVGLPTLNRR